MSAQPEHSAGRPVRAIPHTINGIGEALQGTARAQFYGEVLAAEDTRVPEVMGRWWMKAMLDRAPGADRSRERGSAGQGMTLIEDLMSRLEQSPA
ncbi:hypothetical protein [Streptomyces sp. NPDC018031]|uniref:hypothetical protein n=1 Tax=Streptomyces sp. NPDC018031 TaxID=3365033 RepID=UPI0037A96392